MEIRGKRVSGRRNSACKGPRCWRNSEEARVAGAESTLSAWRAWLDPQAWVPQA